MLMMLFLASCTGTRYMAEDEFLHRNGKVDIKSEDKISNMSELRSGLVRMSEVDQNSKLFWMRMRLSIHNAFEEPNKDKGFKYWLKYKLGKPPVFFNARQVERTKMAMEDYLFNKSYFQSEVIYTVAETKHERKPIYTVTTGRSYTMDSIKYLRSLNPIDAKIELALDKLERWNNEPYAIDKLTERRQQLAFDILNDGYYYFRPNYFEFIADTTQQRGKVDLTMGLKASTPEEAYSQYKIGRVTIEDNFQINTKQEADTQIVRGVYYLSHEAYIKPKVVANAVHISTDSLYNRESHMKTLNHLRSLNVYKFVNILYQRADSSSDRLDARVVLVPLSKMSVSGELNANVKSNNFAGPGVLLSFTNRNTFKGAEVLSLNFGGRFETQVGQSFQGNTSYEIRLDGNLQLPRLFPFKSRQVKAANIPVTNINIGGALQERIDWYRMVNWNSTMRYSWRKSDKISQRFSPLDINLSSLLDTTSEFNQYLEQYPSVRRSFEEQFVVGMNYDFYYSKGSNRLITPFFLSFTLDLSGTGLSLASQLAGGSLLSADSVIHADSSKGQQYKLFSTPYSQYVRVMFDVRKSIEVWPKHVFATRFILAGGVPYGNSRVMPYVKQFYVGGANSLRGFQARSIGPGTYRDTTTNSYVDQAGDLKLEANFEYRFPLWGKLQGAVFTDLGNIWLVNDDPDREGAVLSESTFQLAVSSGLGLRFEINPIIVRFDWAWPMRYPYKVYASGNESIGQGKYWVADQINFASYEWRKENLILNISLGYPF